MNRKVIWRGVAAEVARTIAAGVLPRTVTAEEIATHMHNKYPERGKIPASSLCSVMRQLLDEGVLQKEAPTPVYETLYQGFLLDGDNLIITIGNKTWSFTKGEFSLVAKMFSNLHKWTE